MTRPASFPIASRLAALALVPALLLAAAPAAAEPARPGPAALEARLSLLFTPGGLTADQAARHASATSVEVAARRSEVEAAVAALDQAIVGYFPRLQLGARYTRLSSIGDQIIGTLVASPGAAPGPLTAGSPLVNVPLAIPQYLNQTAFTASLNVPLSDYLLRIPQIHAAADRQVGASKLNEQSARLTAGAQARVTYYGWVRAHLQRVVAEQALEQARAHLEDLRRGAAAGTVARADVLRVESQVSQSELLVLRTGHLAELLHDQLRIALHDPAGTRYAIGEDLRGGAVSAHPLDAATDLESLRSEALHSRLEVRALGESVAAVRQQARAAGAGRYPRLDVTGNATYADPNTRFFPQRDQFSGTWDVSVLLSFSPNDAVAARAARRGGEASARQLESRQAGVREAIASEVMQSYQALREAHLATRTSARGLEAAEAAYDSRRALFRHGRATSVELTDAETDLTRARLEALNARVDVRLARARLEHATGRDAATLEAGR